MIYKALVLKNLKLEMHR